MSQPDWKNRSDTELVVAALLGNLDAFDELAVRFRPAVETVVSQYLESVQDIEDVTQDVLLLAFKALPDLKEPSKFSSWLYAIAKNHAIRYQKRNGRMEPCSELDIYILKNTKTVASDPAQIVERKETHKLLHLILDGLPSEYKIVLKLRYWDEMSIKQLAEFLAIPDSTVKWRLYKGKQLLKQRLEKRLEDFTHGTETRN